jgi:hypothetical protein
LEICIEKKETSAILKFYTFMSAVALGIKNYIWIKNPYIEDFIDCPGISFGRPNTEEELTSYLMDEEEDLNITGYYEIHRENMLSALNEDNLLNLKTVLEMNNTGEESKEKECNKSDYC